MSIQWETRDTILEVVEKIIIPTHTVLDIGAGINPQSFFTPTTHTIIEPFLPYIEVLQKKNLVFPRITYLNGTWDKIMPFFPSKSVDTIFALDVIEHFQKDDGLQFLQEAERIARKQIVIFTPIGMYTQEYGEDNPTDRWGMQGGYWQSHRSGWDLSEFEEDWEVFACKDFHLVDQHDNKLDEAQGAFWAIKTVSCEPVSLAERLYIPEMAITDIAKYLILTIKSRVPTKISNLISKIAKKLSKS